MYARLTTPKDSFNITYINSAFIRNIDELFDYPGDMHDFWEMVYVMEGNATITEDENVYLLSEKNIIFHRPMEFHKLFVQCMQSQVTKVMIISFITEGDAINNLGEAPFKLNDTQHQALLEMYEKINKTSLIFKENPMLAGDEERFAEIQKMIVFSEFTALLLTMSNELSPIKSGDFQVRVTAGINNYKRIVDILNDHAYEDLSVDDIAALSCMSRSNVQKLFKTYSGCGVMQQFNRIKIAKAMDFIKEGQNINEISAKLAFSSPNYFSEVFKREIGVLPSHFKRQVQGFIKQSAARGDYLKQSSKSAR